VLAALAALVVTAAPAPAATSCGREVLDDWYDGRVDGTYPLHCYDDAIEIIPRDVRDYSSAEDDIRRALQAALRGEPAPPNSDPNGPGQPNPGEEPGEDGSGGSGEGGSGDGSEVSSPVGSESASSVPIPLLILSGLALLLVAGGSAGYVIRRIQAGRIPPPAV